jgi:sortase A
LLITGLGVLFHPQLLELGYKAQIAVIKRKFLKQEHPPRGGALYELLKTENETLFQTGQESLVDAFSYEQPAVDLAAYGVEGNCIGFITLPSIGIELPIYLGASAENMRKGAAHMTQTSYPIGGENTNAVIVAHRGRKVLMFRNIHKIQIGDEITVTNFRETLKYRAAEIKIVSPTDVQELLIQPGRDLITLVSCNPLGANYQRYVLFCERV